MATAVAIAIRKAEALDRLEAALTDAATRVGGELPERPAQIHPDLRETVMLEWIADAVEAIGKKPKKAKKADKTDEQTAESTTDEATSEAASDETQPDEQADEPATDEAASEAKDGE